MVVTCLACLLWPHTVTAQATFQERARLADDFSPAPAPKTRLEAFTRSGGDIVLRELTDTGTIEARGTVTVAAIIMRNLTSGTEAKGIALTVRTAAASREALGYVDHDEIESLLAGIDTVARIDPATVKLAKFEAAYQTRGDIRVLMFNTDGVAGNTLASVELGRVAGMRADFKFEDLARLRRFVATAKAILDNPAHPDAKGVRPTDPSPAEVDTSTAPAAPKPKARPKQSPPDSRPSEPNPFPKPTFPKPN
jgi:hypothetical protein